MKKTLVLAVCVLLPGGTAWADWNVGDPVKWNRTQVPDLGPTGMDVKAGGVMPIIPQMKKVLADDFECTKPGLVTDIHIWGGWLHDDLPLDEWGGVSESLVKFNLKIWSDIPASPITGPLYSMPGQVLWERDFSQGDFRVRYAGPIAPGDWFDPNTQLWIDDEHGSFLQYNFEIDPADAFLQTGTQANPIVYWLSVDAMPMGDVQLDPEFGWRTTHIANNWNDDATYSDWVREPGTGNWVQTSQWEELRYPVGHDFATQSIDLAFVITPEPTTMVLLGLGSVALIRRRRK